MVMVFCLFACLFALTIQFVGWIFARILNDDTAGKIASIAISLVCLLVSSCSFCSCGASSCSSGGRNNNAANKQQQADQSAQQEQRQTQSEELRAQVLLELKDRNSATKTSLDNNVSQDEHDSYAKFLTCLSGDNKLVLPNIIDHVGDNVDHNNVDIGMATDDNDDMQQISTGNAEKNNHECDAKLQQQNKRQVVSEIPSTTVKYEEDCGVDIEMAAGDGENRHKSDVEFQSKLRRAVLHSIVKESCT